MAVATAGTITVNGTGENIYSDANGCASFYVRCAAASTTTALINVPGLHAATDFFPLPAGSAIVFRKGFNGITSVFAKGSSGNATVEFGVVSKEPTNAAKWSPVGK